jgi:hypothetical protein
MQCPSCHTENPSTNRFCDQCGEPLEARCPQCATVLRAGARFCGGCGHPLAPSAVSAAPSPSAKPSAPPPVAPSARPIASYTPKHLADKVLKARSAIEGERRQVTVLFADIAGFTSLAERRDPELAKLKVRHEGRFVVVGLDVPLADSCSLLLAARQERTLVYVGRCEWGASRARCASGAWRWRLRPASSAPSGRVGSCG